MHRSDVQATPQVAVTLYTAAFRMGTTHMVADGRKWTSLCRHLIQMLHRTIQKGYKVHIVLT